MYNNNILIINGPNINLIGIREPHLYGNISFKDYIITLNNDSIFKKINIIYKQSNYEGEIINLLHKNGFNNSIKGIILNAGAYAHTSIAIHDAIKSIKINVIEVHITNIYSREIFRHKSYLSSVCKGVICGFGLMSYKLALLSLIS